MYARISALSAGLLVYSVLIPGIAQAESSEVWYEAEHLRWQGEYAVARDKYQQIMAQYPGSPEAQKATLALKRVAFAIAADSKDYERSDAIAAQILREFGNRPEAAEVLYRDIAEKYRWLGAYDRARQAYRQVLRRYASSQWAEKAELGLLRVEFAQLADAGKLLQAHAVADHIVDRFIGKSELAEVLYHDIGEKYRWLGRYADAKTYYQTLIDTYPNSEFTQKATIALRRSEFAALAEQGEMAGAEQTGETLLEDIAADEELSARILFEDIANLYEWQGEYAQASQAYERVRDSYPESKYADQVPARLKACRILEHIDAGRDADASNTIASFTETSEPAQCAKMLYRASEQYMRRAENARAAAKPDAAAANLAEAGNLAMQAVREFEVNQETGTRAILLAAQCYEQLGRYTSAIDCYDDLLGRWPGYDRTWHVMFLKAQAYEAMTQVGDIPKATAWDKIHAIYEQLVDEYPNCKAAAAARRWLRKDSESR
jgi:outer membrane protein assembly factor BamD (BamD/ComL family)